MKLNILIATLVILTACKPEEVPKKVNPANEPEVSANADVSENSPPVNYRDEGHCPFEGCIYGNWSVKENTTVYKDTDIGQAAFQVMPSDKITAVTGVVITKETGQALALKDMELHGEQDLKAQVKKGDIIYVLNYEGEGVYKLWHRGKIVYEQLDPENTKQNPEYTQEHLLGIRTIRLPKTEWWIKIRNSHGEEGWTNQPDNFGNNDRFAG